MKENKEVEINDVSKVREVTGHGMMDCKKALLNNNNNVELAIKYLNECDKNPLFKLGVFVNKRITE